MKGSHCPGCGEVKRLRWPRFEPTFCSLNCAASAAFGLASASCADMHCPRCGRVGCNSDHLPDEPDEEVRID